MNKWMNWGAIIGGIWGIISVTFYYFIAGHGGITVRQVYIFEKILLAPAYLADISVTSIIQPFNWNLWFLASIFLGFLIGVLFGYFIRLYKNSKGGDKADEL